MKCPCAETLRHLTADLGTTCVCCCRRSWVRLRGGWLSVGSGEIVKDLDGRNNDEDRS